MKEKEIVDFTDKTKFTNDETDEYELIDKETGKQVGCRICYTHAVAFRHFNKLMHEYAKSDKYPINVIPLCPKCQAAMTLVGRSTDEFGYDTVSETNFSNPEGEIGYYLIVQHPETEKCEYDGKDFALIPTPVIYNANHDIHYTGGKHYVNDEDIKRLIEDISEQIKKNVQQYVTRKVKENDDNLYDWQLDAWNGYSVEYMIAKFLYEKGWKK